MDLDLLERSLADAGQPAFRAKQIWEWAARGVGDYDAMTNVPGALRDDLPSMVPFSTLEVVEEAHARDGTVKTLFNTHDNRPVEAVLMRYRDGRRSLCLSSQSGCPLTCTFCATGTMKFGRNLSAWEILDQALHFRRMLRATGGSPTSSERRAGSPAEEPGPDHVVFMGMGEPMMNLDNVLDACRRLPDIGVTHRRTAISTVGWIPGIDRLADSDMPLRLALSLHAADDKLRTELMPVNKRYPLADVLEHCRRFYAEKKRMVFIEYVMLDGVNDHYEHAHALANVLDPRMFKVNLIPYNPTGSFDGSAPEKIGVFRDVLEQRGIKATVRLTRGRDIAAACGQLAAGQAA